MASATVRNVPLLEDDSIPFGEEDELRRNDQKHIIPHPYVAFFHLFFRGASIVTYMLCGWFSDSFITSFVCVVLLLSADFWTVKNITGRLLVGLRWWNYVDDEGVSHWVYESRKGDLQGRINAQESQIFWLALVLCPVMWAVFFIIALFGLKFRWLLLVMIALALNGANLYGYIKCNYGANKDLKSAATDFARSQLFKGAADMLFKQQVPQPTTARPTNVV